MTSTRLFPLQPRPGPTFCVPGERLLVAFIAVIIRPLPRGHDWPRSGGSQGGDRRTHVAWEARQEKGYSLPSVTRLPGPWHFNGVHALLYRKDGTRDTVTGLMKKVLARSASGCARAAVDRIAIKDQRFGDCK